MNRVSRRVTPRVRTAADLARWASKFVEPNAACRTVLSRGGRHAESWRDIGILPPIRRDALDALGEI